jgi:hypothetical protein
MTTETPGASEPEDAKTTPVTAKKPAEKTTAAKTTAATAPAAKKPAAAKTTAAKTTAAKSTAAKSTAAKPAATTSGAASAAKKPATAKPAAETAATAAAATPAAATPAAAASVAPASAPSAGVPAAGAATKTNTLAIIAIIAAIIVPPLGIVLAILARGQIKTSGEGGAGLAKAALIVGIVLTALWLLLTLGFVIVITIFGVIFNALLSTPMTGF